MYFFWIAFILQQFSFRSVCLHAQYHDDAMPMIPTFDCIDIDMLAELSWARTLVSDDLPLPPSGPAPSALSPSSKPQPIMRLWPEPDVWCAELWLFQINYLMTWCCIHLMPRSLTCTPRLSRLSRTEREKLAGNGFSNNNYHPCFIFTFEIPISYRFQFSFHPFEFILHFVEV